MRLLLLVGTLCLTAGCLGLGDPQPDPTQELQVSIDNGHDQGYVVQVAVVPDGPTTVELTFANGTNVTRSTDSLVGRSPTQLGTVTDVQFVGATRSEAYEVPANSGVGTTVRGLEPGSSVWLLVWTTDDRSQVRSWTRSSCSPETAVVVADLDVASDGSIGLGTVCESL